MINERLSRESVDRTDRARAKERESVKRPLILSSRRFRHLSNPFTGISVAFGQQWTPLSGRRVVWGRVNRNSVNRPENYENPFVDAG